MDLIDSLDRTFQHAHGILGGVRAEQYDDPTPCEEWTVRQLVEHMTSVVAGIGAAAGASPPGDASVLGPDPAAQFQQVAASNLAAWRAPGALDQVVVAGAGPMPGRVLAGINLLDAATHSWDLATATGQPARLPDDVAEAALEASAQIVSPEVR